MITNAKEWEKIPRPPGWHPLCFHMMFNTPKNQKPQGYKEPLFAYNFACMLQKDTGWN
jgi:hypothetical protein